MADEIQPGATPSDNQQPTTPSPATNQTQSASPGSQTDSTKLAEELGRLKAENEAFKKYQQQVDPVIQTLYSDKELLDKATEVHNKRMGIAPSDDEPTTPETPQAPPVDRKAEDSHNYLRAQAVKDFYARHGIDKLDGEARTQMDTAIATVLQETFNPTGGKTLSQIVDDIPLDHLPEAFDKAYFWANRHQIEAKAREEGRREALGESAGFIGGMPSGTGSSEEVVLSPQERQLIQKAGWSEEAYLKNKKQVQENQNKLY